MRHKWLLTLLRAFSLHSAVGGASPAAWPPAFGGVAWACVVLGVVGRVLLLPRALTPPKAETISIQVRPILATVPELKTKQLG